MTNPIDIGLIGCGKRFRKIYLPILQELRRRKKINIKNIFVRELTKYKDISKIFNCNLTTNLNDLLKDQKLKFLIITTPYKFRKEIFLNKFFQNKKVILEVPFSNNLAEYFFFKKILKRKKISFEVFEDRYYMKVYNIQKKIELIENQNKEWMHHFIGACCNLSKNLNNINKIYYNKDKFNYDNYKILTKNLILKYRFYQNKKKARQLKKFFKIVYNISKFKIYKKVPSLNEKRMALKKCLDNFFFKKNQFYGIYVTKHLFFENLCITLMKLTKKLNIKELKLFEIKFIVFFFKLISFLKR